MKRFKVIYIFLILFFAVAALRLVQLQIVNGESARREVSARLSLAETQEAPRGEITDRNGVVLAGNRQGYIVRIKKGKDEEVDLTVKNLAAVLGVTEAQMRDEMKEQDFSYYNPYVAAEDADDVTVTKIKESPEAFPCVDIKIRPLRKYFYPETAVHLLGRCGLISREEYENSTGYTMNDYIGKQGAEKAFEEILKGTDGKIAVEKSGKTYDTDVAPVQGKTIALTIDLTLQQAAEKALFSVIAANGTATAGAMVITDVNSGEVLALASYPSYNINEFNKNYKTLAQNPNKPMFNRAIAGLYEPGSTFKPVSAIAALGEGTLKPDETIKTKGVYHYYDRDFRCNIYRETGKTHGTINVSQALGVSCNYFFYEIAHRTGIDAIAKTAEDFGLGAPCGIELSGEEATGKIASPKNRSTHWYAGDTLQASIGQSDNRFTPIALANYAAALANGGKVYSAHILKSVDGAQTAPTLLNEVETDSKTLSAIHQGMVYVTKQGTAKEIFRGFPVSVAGKTGSAQVSGRTNGLFLGFAPAKNPEIAFCAVIEGAPSGNVAAEAVKQAISTYFNIE